MLISMSKPTANGRAAVNLERRLDHDGHPLAITAADAVAASGVSPWNWRDNPGNGPCNRFPPVAICRLSILNKYCFWEGETCDLFPPVCIEVDFQSLLITC